MKAKKEKMKMKFHLPLRFFYFLFSLPFGFSSLVFQDISPPSLPRFFKIPFRYTLAVQVMLHGIRARFSLSIWLLERPSFGLALAL